MEKKTLRRTMLRQPIASRKRLVAAGTEMTELGHVVRLLVSLAVVSTSKGAWAGRTFVRSLVCMRSDVTGKIVGSKEYVGSNREDTVRKRAQSHAKDPIRMN